MNFKVFIKPVKKKNNDEKLNILESYGISLVKSGDAAKAKEFS